jgi:cytidine deaminase
MTEFSFPYGESLKSNLPGEDQELIAAAELAAEGAYAPYSGFKVGSAVRLDDGRIVSGSNHENASYPAGICAERAALATLDMRAGQHKVKAIAVTYISAKQSASVQPPLSPCGLCRQSILEVQQWQQTPIRLLLCSPDGPVITIEDSGHLLPFSFGSSYLGQDSPLQ